MTPQPLESYTPEEQEVLQIVARSHGKEHAEQYARLILWQAVIIGDLADSVHADGGEIFDRALIAQRKRIRASGD
jgi:hypothetical protein